MKSFFKFAFLLLLTNGAVKAQTDSSTFAEPMAGDKRMAFKAEIRLDEVAVQGITATSKLPVTFTNIGRKEIQARYYGADIPSLINRTPSVNSYSDNGTGIGYSFFRLRGIDQTRINTTINGIPVNDPETQGVYFNNFADLATGVENIQVQRGVGTSTNGTSAFGGSINVLLSNPAMQPSVKVYTGMGSFGSRRVSVAMNSGRLGDHFCFSGRYSELKSDGFRANSSTAIQSYAFNLSYVSANSVLSLIMFGGRAQNQLAYSGIDKATFKANNKTNNFINGESDAFRQQFYQLQYALQINRKSVLSASAYYVRGGAPKFQFLFPGAWGYGFDYFNMPNAIVGSDTITTAGDMMTSYRLDQHYRGAFITYRYVDYAFDFTAGVHANAFKSDHFMEINWGSIIPQGIGQNHLVYFNTGNKNEVSAFAKVNYHVSREFSVFADAQVRAATFKYDGRDLAYRTDPYIVEPMRWMFFNPKLGARYNVNLRHSVYGMAGMSSREPTRFDYFQDDFATHDVKQNEIKPEQVLDLEAGYDVNTKLLQGKVNFFAMEFSNQIVASGLLNAFGYPVTANVGKSFRRGVEFDLNFVVNKYVHVFYSGSLSNNRIKELVQHYNNDSMGTIIGDSIITYKNTATAYSPAMIHNIGLWCFATSWLSAELLYRHVGSQYLDNTQNKDLSLPAFSLFDLRISVGPFKWIKAGSPVIQLQLNNLTGVKYAPAGSLGGYNTITSAGSRGHYPLYFPAAGRNFFVTINWNF